MITVDTTLAGGTWVADPVHSDISFKVRHMGVGKVRGTFALASAALTVGDDGGRVTALIDPASVDTGNRQRDQHITSADFLDVENHPQIEFTSTEVRDFDGETFVRRRQRRGRRHHRDRHRDRVHGHRTGPAMTLVAPRRTYRKDREHE
jgi:polyisoprenoid-binding protein YceI